MSCPAGRSSYSAIQMLKKQSVTLIRTGSYIWITIWNHAENGIFPFYSHFGPFFELLYDHPACSRTYLMKKDLS